MKLTKVYTPQSYIDNTILAEKRENHDYTIFVAKMKDDNRVVYMCVDGNHSLRAAQADGVAPEIVEVESEYKSVEEYVIAFGDLDNPENVVSGKSLW